MPPFLNLPAYQVPGPLDMQPLSAGIDAIGDGVTRWRDTANRQKLGGALAKGDYSGARTVAAQMGDPDAVMKVQGLQDDREEKLKQRYGRMAAMVGRETDPARKSALWQRMSSSLPGFEQALARYGIDPSDIDTGSRFILTEAGMAPPEAAQPQMRVVGNQVVRIDPATGKVSVAHDASAGATTQFAEAIEGANAVETLFGGADAMQQSFLSGNFDEDLERVLEGVAPNHRARVWIQAQQIKQRAAKMGQGAVTPPAAGPASAQPLPAATPTIDQQRLELVAQRFADAPAAQKNDAFRIQASANAIEKSLKRYEDLVKETGYVVSPGADRDAVGAEIRNLQLQLKELYNLGVLNGPDLMLMETVLADPRVDSFGSAMSAGYDVAFGQGGGARIKASTSRLRTILNDILKGRSLEPIGEGTEKDQSRQPPPAQPGGDVSSMSDDELLKALGQ